MATPYPRDLSWRAQKALLGAVAFTIVDLGRLDAGTREWFLERLDYYLRRIHQVSPESLDSEIRGLEPAYEHLLYLIDGWTARLAQMSDEEVRRLAQESKFWKDVFDSMDSA